MRPQIASGSPGQARNAFAGRAKRVGAGAALWLLAAAAAPAMAQTVRLALVIGNSAYTSMPAIPPLPVCTASARGVAQALRDLGYTVTERLDLARGELDATIANFARSLREAPGAVAVGYVCGHLASANARPFLLPVSANLQRESDLLSQGVLVRLVLDALVRGQVRSGLVAMDAATPAAPGVVDGVAALVPGAAAAGIGLAVALMSPDEAATPLSAALIAGLAQPQVRLASLLSTIRQRLPEGALVAFGEPASPGFLAGEPPPAAAAAALPAAAAPLPPGAPAAAPQAAPGTAVTSPVGARPPAVSPGSEAQAVPDEKSMTLADRRRVQAALARMGYYEGATDGVFGANTRAAIRRFQFELRAELTGTLTASQATRLVQSP